MSALATHLDMYSFQETVEGESWVMVTSSLGSEENTSPPTVSTDMSDQRSQETCTMVFMTDNKSKVIAN